MKKKKRIWHSIYHKYTFHEIYLSETPRLQLMTHMWPIRQLVTSLGSTVDEGPADNLLQGLAANEGTENKEPRRRGRKQAPR